ncbi:complex I subunit 5 family protein [Thiohalorhabdus denitrificans]|uniref:complex I subunit 5 family protein n=1 Tax=Thiohalorhabdus denitrificans TaxID=381306 RepID=UPI001E54F490|nr:proton-conducting transporter membrane subunit [Thiohalorhabdus denitrificans]
MVALPMLPLAVALLVFVFPELRRWAAVAGTAGIAAALAAAGGEVATEGARRYAIGGWPAPPGIALLADPLSVLLLGLTTVVSGAATFYALGYWAGHRDPDGRPDPRERAFWPLWWMLWAGLNALFLAGDAFNAYVALEVLSLAAVALVAVAGDAGALRAALRYLLVSLAGSLAYLAGVALLYAEHGLLDLASLAEAVEPGPEAVGALAVITAGLLMKTALFPLHFWLPGAHSRAPGPVSAVLSGLVVKAGFFLLLRYWFWVYGGWEVATGTALIGSLGAVAVLWGSVQALAALRLKLLVAYSTVAQLGYLFLAFALISEPGVAGNLGQEGALYLALSHGLAKGGAFLMAGTCLWAAGNDRLEGIGDTLRQLPVSTAAFALAGISLIGLPPTGGFVGKWLLLRAMAESEAWVWLAVIAAGTFLATGYIFRVLVPVFQAGTEPPPLERTPPRIMEVSALLLAVAAVGMGFLAPVFEPLMLGLQGPSP